MMEVEYESLQEPSTNWGLCETLNDYDSSDEGTQAWTDSEEPHGEASPLEIHIIIPPPFIEENSYKDLKWPALPPSSFGPYFKASQAHYSKKSSLAQMFFIGTNFSKLERVHNRDPWDMLYDTYDGRKPLFDDVTTQLFEPLLYLNFRGKIVIIFLKT